MGNTHINQILTMRPESSISRQQSGSPNVPRKQRLILEEGEVGCEEELRGLMMMKYK